MIKPAESQALLRGAFLDLFPEDCRENCMVAKMAAAKAARQVLEFETTYDKVAGIHAHRFGRCVLGPSVDGMCGKKSTCNNELVAAIEDPFEATEVLTIL